MTPHRVRPRARNRAAAAIATILATITTLTTGGCGLTSDPYDPTTDEQAAEAARVLPTLPTLEDTETQLRAAIEHLGEQASTIAPVLKWRWIDEPSYGGCLPPFDKTEGQNTHLSRYVSDIPIPEQNWAEILAVAEQAARKLGLAGVQVFHDEPGDRDMAFYNQTGTTLRFGSYKAALITAKTGCRLPRNKMPHPDS